MHNPNHDIVIAALRLGVTPAELGRVINAQRTEQLDRTFSDPVVSFAEQVNMQAAEHEQATAELCDRADRLGSHRTPGRLSAADFQPKPITDVRPFDDPWPMTSWDVA